MRNKTIVEIFVGLFMLAGIAALVILAFKVSGLTNLHGKNTYYITADFDNIGGLKVRAPVSLAGVVIGEVDSINLDPNTFRAHVLLAIDKNVNNIPTDTTASILTQGILGANYISLTPGFDNTYLKNGGQIESTRSAIILENLIGQLLYNVKGGSSDKNKESTNQ